MGLIEDEDDTAAATTTTTITTSSSSSSSSSSHSSNSGSSMTSLNSDRILEHKCLEDVTDVNTKVQHMERGCEYVIWIYAAQDKGQWNALSWQGRVKKCGYGINMISHTHLILSTSFKILA
jgi:hypothetical protein